MIKNKLKSIEFKTLLFILLFNVGMILILCFAELVAFTQYYRYYRMQKLEDIVKEYQTSKKDIYALSEQMAYDNEVCITVLNEYYMTYNYNTLQIGCILGENNDKVSSIMEKFIASSDESNSYTIIDPNTKTQGIIYALKVNGNNIFIYSSLEQVSGFIKIIKNQMIYFIIIVILISMFISVFLANKITKPIREITKKAKKLGERKYDIDFPKNGISEIDTLSATLDGVQTELRKNDEVKRDLMANVSHDLKTPLTMIKAYAEMIKDISYKDQAKMNEHLDIIMEESDRLTILVNDILELSKTQSNVSMYNYEEYDLIKEIKKIIKRYSVMKELENYKFETDLPKKAIITADKNKINQVIYNLLNNAINYTGDDKVVKIRVTKEENSYLIEIIDTGKGIKKEEIPYIWDKYYKSEKKHQRNVVSTGLGLSIVKEILNKHNFEYGVSSKEGVGSTFYFKINM